MHGNATSLMDTFDFMFCFVLFCFVFCFLGVLRRCRPTVSPVTDTGAVHKITPHVCRPTVSPTDTGAVHQITPQMV